MASFESLLALASAAYMVGADDTPADATGNGRDATWAGTPAYTDGPNTRAFDLTAATLSASLGQHYGNGPLTLLMRLRLLTLPGTGYAAGQSTAWASGWQVRVAGNALGAYAGGAHSTALHTVSVDTWHSIALRIDTDTDSWMLRLDGANSPEIAFTGTPATDLRLDIGSRNGASPLRGYYAELMVLPVAASDEQLAAYDAGPSASSLVLPIVFEEALP
ncbi:MAG: hypothetical protein AAGJ46_12100 [Planctomycetota bacterium]